MTALLRAELIKLRTTRTFVALAGVAVGISLLVTVLVAVLTEPSREDVLTEVFSSDASSFFVLVLALVGITGEWRHRTIVSSLLAEPDRIRFLASKTLAFAAAGLLLSLLISIAITAAGLAILSIRDLPLPEAGELVEQLARNALVAALLGAFGVAIGAVFRNQLAAIVIVLGLYLLIEPAVVVAAPEVGRFSPFGMLPTAIAGPTSDDAGLGSTDLPSPGVAVFAMLTWIGALFAAGAALLRRRDVP